jgi:hypothetical protein
MLEHNKGERDYASVTQFKFATCMWLKMFLKNSYKSSWYLIYRLFRNGLAGRLAQSMPLKEISGIKIPSTRK